MKKFYILALLLIVLVIFLSGCFDRGEVQVGLSFVGGTEGLDIAFREDEPPARVLDDGVEDFYITIDLENKGEDTVEIGDAAVLISGISAQEFGLADIFFGNLLLSYNEEDILAVRKDRNDIIRGGVGSVSFGPASYLPNAIADIEYPVQADVCYLYETEAISSLCLKRNVIQRSREEVGEACTIDAVKNVESSGAPVIVSNFRERPSGANQVRFSFDVTNVGDGEVWSIASVNPGLIIWPYNHRSVYNILFDVFDSEADYPCSESVMEGTVGLERDRVFVYVEPTLEPVTNLLDIKCSKFDDLPYGVARLGSDGRVTVTCTMDTAQLQSVPFESQLNIYVDYAYKETVRTRLLVEDALAGEEELEMGSTIF